MGEHGTCRPTSHSFSIASIVTLHDFGCESTFNDSIAKKGHCKKEPCVGFTYRSRNNEIGLRVEIAAEYVVAVTFKCLHASSLALDEKDSLMTAIMYKSSASRNQVKSSDTPVLSYLYTETGTQLRALRFLGKSSTY